MHKRNTIVKENGHIRENEYLNIASYKIEDKELIIILKNISKYKLDTFYGNIALTDYKLKNIRINMSENYFELPLNINPNETCRIKVKITDWEDWDIKNKKYLFMDIKSISFTDGKYTVNLSNHRYGGFEKEVRAISDSRVQPIKEKINKEKKKLTIEINNTCKEKSHREVHK